MIAWFDTWTYEVITSFMLPWLSTAMGVITYLGGIVALLIICAVLLIVPKLRKDYGVPAVAATIASAALAYILKLTIARPRPDTLQSLTEVSYSFPSGHAMVSAALYVTLALIIWRQLKGYRVRAVVPVACSVLVLAIGLSRVYLGAHYVSDVIVGWILGSLIAYGSYWILVRRDTPNSCSLEAEVQPTEADN